MTWFKVDDKLHSHNKRMKAGLDAMGLWVVAGSRCGDHLSDGFVPGYWVDEVDPRSGRERAASLVSAGLWSVTRHAGDEGWRFHDWAEHQPSATDVKSQRAASTERQRKWRERKAAGQSVDASVTRHAGADVTSTETARDAPPTRPDPTRPVLPTEVEEHSPAAPSPRRAPRSLTEPDSFVEFWDAYGKIGSRKTAVTAYGKALGKTDAATLLASVLAHWSGPWAKKDRDYIPHAATWLNRESWNDEMQPGRKPLTDAQNRHEAEYGWMRDLS